MFFPYLGTVCCSRHPWQLVFQVEDMIFERPVQIFRFGEESGFGEVFWGARF